MSIVLAWAMGLLGFLGLLVPLLVHLERRTRTVEVEFAALRWLRASASPRRNVRLRERVLLALRMLLVGALAFLLAGPVLRGADADGTWNLVHPTLDPVRVQRELANSGESAQAWRWLAPGFPPIDAPAPSASVRTASLLRELDTTLAAGATLNVWVPQRLDGLDGASLALSRDVRWHTVSGRVFPRAANTTAVVDFPLPVFAVRHAPARTTELRFVTAAWTAAVATTAGLRRAPVLGVSTGRDTPSQGQRHLIWLHDEPPSPGIRAWVRSGGTLVLDSRATWPRFPERASVAWHAASGEILAVETAVGNGRVVRLIQPLDARRMPQLLDGSFADALPHLLQPTTPAPDRGEAQDVAPVVLARARNRTAAPIVQAGTSLTTPLLVVIALLFLTERWFATGPRTWRRE